MNMGQAIAQIDPFTQQNAAMVEESAAAGGLQQQSHNPVEVVGRFRIHAASR